MLDMDRIIIKNAYLDKINCYLGDFILVCDLALHQQALPIEDGMSNIAKFNIILISLV